MDQRTLDAFNKSHAEWEARVNRMSTAYERVLARRSKRLGVSLEEAAKITAKPRYLQAVEAAASRRGVTVETVLEEDFRRSRS
jgi:hypothetical protein